jgi:hypothetical protein
MSLKPQPITSDPANNYFVCRRPSTVAVALAMKSYIAWVADPPSCVAPAMTNDKFQIPNGKSQFLSND